MHAFHERCNPTTQKNQLAAIAQCRSSFGGQALKAASATMLYADHLQLGYLTQVEQYSQMILCAVYGSAAVSPCML
jgi:hypothetical protein